MHRSVGLQVVWRGKHGLDYSVSGHSHTSLAWIMMRSKVGQTGMRSTACGTVWYSMPVVCKLADLALNWH